MSISELMLTVERQSMRVEPKGKAIPDEKQIKELGLAAQNAHLYVRDLGPQIPWKTVSDRSVGIGPHCNTILWKYFVASRFSALQSCHADYECSAL